MTSPSNPDNPSSNGRRENDVDAVFAELVSSMPDLACIDEPTREASLEAVEIIVPHPSTEQEPLRMVIEVPAEIAPMLKAEFSPARVAAMMQAIDALMSLSEPPQS